MTTVEFFKEKDGSYKGFVCMGHADYAKKYLLHKEPDILCSAISVLVINALNALTDIANEDIDVQMNEETGFIKCDIHSNLQEKSIFLMDALVLGLQNLSEEYGTKYLLVRIKEV